MRPLAQSRVTRRRSNPFDQNPIWSQHAQKAARVLRFAAALMLRRCAPSRVTPDRNLIESKRGDG
jgi:hypothetical protein